MKFNLIIRCIFLCPIFLLAEIQYSHSGYFNLGTIHRLSDGSIIKIPYRMVKYEPVLSLNNFNLVSNTALEFRLKDIDNVFGSELEFIPGKTDDDSRFGCLCFGLVRKETHLTKSEAENIMKLLGAKVSHPTFSYNEWISMVSPHTIITAEGYKMDCEEFWSYRDIVAADVGEAEPSRILFS